MISELFEILLLSLIATDQCVSWKNKLTFKSNGTSNPQILMLLFKNI